MVKWNNLAGPFEAGNVKGFEGMLIPCFVGFGVFLFLIIDNGLKLYWLGGLVVQWRFSSSTQVTGL